MTFLTGRRVTAVMADLTTFIPVRHKPTGPVETFSTERAAETVPVDIRTEDVATILLRFEGGARGQVAVSQLSPGRKNSLQYEIDGSASAVAWDSEQPEQLWIGHRDRPNELLLRNPALMNDARRRGRAPARRPRRGLRRHVRRAVHGHLRGRRSPAGPSAHAALRRRSRTATTRCSSATRSPRALDRRLGDVVRDAARSRAAGAPPIEPPHGGLASMKLGFLTAPFPETPLMDVADWAAGAGFEVLEIACWPQSTGPTRRYAGTSHIDVANLSRRAGDRDRRRDRGQGPRRSPASASTPTRSTRTRSIGRRSSATCKHVIDGRARRWTSRS